MGASARPLRWLGSTVPVVGVCLLTVILSSAGVADAVSKPTQPALFLTVKSSNFGDTKLDHIESGYLIVTDILISPDGVPLPFFKDNCVYKKRAGLKIIVSFGGSVVPSELFVYLSSDERRRAAFVDNLVEFTLTNGFHGIDLSWLYPAPQEREQYVRLLRDLRLACDRNGLRLTVTVPSRPSVIEVNYPVEKLAKYADFVILSTTEFRKLRKTSFIAPLYSSSPGSANNIDYHVDRWKMAGLCSSKIVIVIQTMTLTYKLYIQNEYRVGTPALQLKIRPYYKICRKLYSGSLEIWDASAKSPYAFRDLSWYSYENEKSIKEKVCFVVQQGLGGLAVFYYDEDDPINICGDGQYPLTAIVLAALQTDYQPPSVISEPQIYHFESPAFGGYPNPGPYNGQPYAKKPMVIYVDEAEDTKRPSPGAKTQPAPQTVPVASDPMAAFTEVLYEPMDNKFINSIVPDGSESDEFGDSSAGDAFFFQQPATGVSSYMVDIGGGVDMELPMADQDSFSILTSLQHPPPGASPAATAQLYSESGCSAGAMNPSAQLFSEQGSPSLPALYREPRKKCCAVLPPSVTGHFPPAAPEGIRFIATAQIQTPATTTTTTTTTVPPPPIQFFAKSAVTFRPPPAYCPHPLRFALNAVVSAAPPPPVTSTASPPTPATRPPMLPPSCPMARLYSEHSAPQSKPPPMPGVQFHAMAVGGPPAVAFAPYTVTICPADGIVQDPHDRRSYYLCKRGLPMCDENKFNCAHGYFFDVASQKCQRESGA